MRLLTHASRSGRWVSRQESGHRTRLPLRRHCRSYWDPHPEDGTRLLPESPGIPFVLTLDFWRPWCRACCRWCILDLTNGIPLAASGGPRLLLKTFGPYFCFDTWIIRDKLRYMMIFHSRRSVYTTFPKRLHGKNPNMRKVVLTSFPKSLDFLFVLTFGFRRTFIMFNVTSNIKYLPIFITHTVVPTSQPVEVPLESLLCNQYLHYVICSTPLLRHWELFLILMKAGFVLKYYAE